MNIINLLNWRYATKRYENKKIPAEQVHEITESIRLTASSGGIQPYKIIVVENDEDKKKLQAASFNPQVSECSHLLVFAAYTHITQNHIEDYVRLIAQTRNVTVESMDAFKTRMQGNLLGLSSDEAFNWASKQAYIGLGTGLIAAANLQIDSSPMEGFKPAEFDEILNLKEKGLKSVVLLALGYRHEANDFLWKLKKVRVPEEQFIIKAD